MGNWRKRSYMKRLRKFSGINNSSISGSYYYYEFHYFKDMTSYSRRPAMGVLNLPCWDWREGNTCDKSSLLRRDNMI